MMNPSLMGWLMLMRVRRAKRHFNGPQCADPCAGADSDGGDGMGWVLLIKVCSCI
jgi:hypothetical protein